ncbi:GRB2-associated-binding protein 3 isoform X2 [Enhydra lutris kenyoni]|uniref:GRB2-associated-binding protein 3 isoform X2 n=1 Tax=Enhydra lutris kenyoni TaxID=391180 RepID=A0A2Y9IFM1_ENHLU|nr:GRB2-associated-binding protein 3 isoform X2 [Enhydra lutris kenyoni]
MSAGDAVCTGWLVKSPPERKLQRYAWRRRWFVLRRGRMSGSPDMLEYYRSKHASKPIRAIDLSECAVWRHVGPGFLRKEFQNNFVFIVKTTSRTFYLVAKTEVEMLVWVYSISQVCNLGQLEEGADPTESCSCGPPALQPAPGSSLPSGCAPSASGLRGDVSTDFVASEDSRSESEFLPLPDYLILSNCETGPPRQASLPSRCDSCSTSERSLEQVSSDDVFVDGPPSVAPAGSGRPLRCGSGSQKVPSLRPQAALTRSRDSTGPARDRCSSPLPETPLNATVQVDKNQGLLPYEAAERDLASGTPPPRPPKPSHLSERRHIGRPESTAAPRRVSLSGLDNVSTWKADVEGQSLRHRDKRLSLNLPCGFSPVCPTAPVGAEDSYVPMGPQAAGSSLQTPCGHDDYIPMSPGSLSSPLPELPVDLEPPPVNRDLKPQRKPRPPPLDLRNLSTIREHTCVTRTCTVPCNRTRFLSPERNGINSARFFANSVSREEEESYIHMENHRAAHSLSGGALTWARKSSLDYLALDFNSASPAPAQQKLLVSEEHRVDYVQVDERKTQALRSTRQEWTDERQSKV